MELDESIMYTQYYDKLCDFSDLTYDEKACLKLDKVDTRDSDVESDYDEEGNEEEETENTQSACKGEDAQASELPYFKVWFDFETFTEGLKHEPYLVCYIDKFNNEKIFTGENCAKEMLESLSYDKNIYKRYNAHST